MKKKNSFMIIVPLELFCFLVIPSLSPTLTETTDSFLAQQLTGILHGKMHN